jgi:hypothetical protein
MEKVSSRRKDTKCSRYVCLNTSSPPLTLGQFFMQIIPPCFSRGSEKRKYVSLTVHRGDFEAAPSAVQTVQVPITPPIETNPHNKNSGVNWLSRDWPQSDWRLWAEEPWAYLLDPPRETETGPILCVSRGKLLVIAAGHVSNPDASLTLRDL